MEHHGLNSYPIPPPTEGPPLLARGDKAPRLAFGRIQGPLGGPQRSNPHTYVYHCIRFCMSNMHTKFQLSVLINKKVFTCGGLQPQARAASRPLGELTHKYTYHWIPIYMNNMHTKSQLSNLINKKSSEYAYGVISRFLRITPIIENHVAPVLK